MTLIISCDSLKTTSPNRVMGINREWKNKESAKELLENLKEFFFESIKPYFLFSGNLDLAKNDSIMETGDILARIVNSSLTLTENEKDSFFGADSVIAQKVIIENHESMKFWGKILWLSTPSGHKSYKSGYDPFYAEFRLKEDGIVISKMKFSDYKITNLDKVWWFDMELDWMYEFEE